MRRLSGSTTARPATSLPSSPPRTSTTAAFACGPSRVDGPPFPQATHAHAVLRRLVSVRRRARCARLGAALAVVLAAAGCGGGTGPVSSGPPGIDSPDATFDASGGPEQLAFDAAGNLYVSDCFAARVY